MGEAAAAMAVGAAVGGGASLIGGILQRDAATQQGRAQQAIAEAQLAEEKKTREAALQQANSPEEIAQLQRSVQMNETDVSRKQRVLDSIDPTLIETGKQALSLLQGKEAAILDPIKRQRALDRQKLQDRLNAQFGTGYESSSAAQRALNDFDRQTADSLAVAQDQAIGRLLNASIQGAGINSVGTNIQSAQNIGQLFGNAAGRRVNAITQTPIQNAGAPFVGAAFQGAAEQQIIGNIFGGITQGATMGGMLGGRSPQANTFNVGSGGSSYTGSFTPNTTTGVV